MTMRRKTLLWVSMIIAGIIGISWFVSSTVLLRGLTRIEQETAHQGLQRVLESFSDHLSTLNHTARDWAVREGNTSPGGSGTSFTTLQPDLVLITDPFGWTVFGQALDPKDHREIPLSRGTEDYFSYNHLLLHHSGAKSSRAGLVLLPEGPALVAFCPIPDRGAEDAVRGTLIVGHYLDAVELSRSAGRIRPDLSLQRLDDSRIPDDFRTAYASLSGKKSTFIHRFNEESIAGYTTLKDIQGNPALMIRLMTPETLSREGRKALHYLVLLLTGTGVVMGGLILVFLERGVFSRLDRLSEEVKGIGKSKDFAARVPMTGSRDELSTMAVAVNGMLGAMERSQHRLYTACSGLEEKIRSQTAGLTKTRKALRAEIVKRRTAEEALRQNGAKRLKAIFDTVQTGILITEADDHIILDANPAAARMIGASTSQLVGSRCSRYMDSSRKEPASSPERDTGNSEDAIWRTDGTSIPVIKTVTPVTVDSRRLLIESFTDISELKRSEEKKRKQDAQLYRTRKMEAVGTLAVGIAHDFTDILSVIVGYTQMALKDRADQSRIKYYLDQVMKAGHRANQLVEQILVLNRCGEEKKELVQVGSIVKEALQAVKTSLPDSVELHQEIESTGLVLTESNRIRQIVMNLCTNAHQAMGEGGGVLRVSLKNVDIDAHAAVHDPDLKAGPYLRLTVRDEGNGMNTDTMERIFDPYFTTKGSGNGKGLGLSMVYGVVKNLGGTVKVHSQSGKGSSFHVFLPRVGYVKKGLKEELRPKFPPVKERILLVDDDTALVTIGHEILKRFGYDVTTRTNGVEALSLFRKEPKQFDLVITDQTMPNMTGIEMAKEFLTIRPDIPIILCSGLSETTTEQNARDLGIRTFVTKPFITRELAATIRNVLNGNGHGHD